MYIRVIRLAANFHVCSVSCVHARILPKQQFKFTCVLMCADTGQIHLCPMDYKDVHAICAVDLDGEALDYSTFCRIWQSEFPNVKIPPEQRLGKCDCCQTLHEKILTE